MDRVDLRTLHLEVRSVFGLLGCVGRAGRGVSLGASPSAAGAGGGAALLSRSRRERDP